MSLWTRCNFISTANQANWSLNYSWLESSQLVDQAPELKFLQSITFLTRYCRCSNKKLSNYPTWHPFTDCFTTQRVSYWLLTHSLQWLIPLIFKVGVLKVKQVLYFYFVGKTGTLFFVLYDNKVLICVTLVIGKIIVQNPYTLVFSGTWWYIPPPGITFID